MTFTIPYPSGKRGKVGFCRRFGLNAYYAGKPWPARKRDADELHSMALAAMRKANIPKKLLDCPVKVKFYWDDGLDVDNHAGVHTSRRQAEMAEGRLPRDVGRRVHPGGNFGGAG